MQSPDGARPGTGIDAAVLAQAMSGVGQALQAVSVEAVVGADVGAALGAWLRWTLGLLLTPLHPHLPLGTWVANLAGGLLIGACLAWFSRHPEVDAVWRLTVVTGFLG